MGRRRRGSKDVPVRIAEISEVQDVLDVMAAEADMSNGDVEVLGATSSLLKEIQGPAATAKSLLTATAASEANSNSDFSFDPMAPEGRYHVDRVAALLETPIRKWPEELMPPIDPRVFSLRLALNACLGRIWDRYSHALKRTQPQANAALVDKSLRSARIHLEQIGSIDPHSIFITLKARLRAEFQTEIEIVAQWLACVETFSNIQEECLSLSKRINALLSSTDIHSASPENADGLLLRISVSILSTSWTKISAKALTSTRGETPAVALLSALWADVGEPLPDDPVITFSNAIARYAIR